MAAPSYTTDLALFKDFETAVTFSEWAGFTGGRGQAIDTDYPIQESSLLSTVMNSTGNASSAIDYGSNITWTSGWAIFSWIIWLAPGTLNTKVNGGLMFAIGADVSNFREYYVGGSNFGSYPYGGWQNFAVNPEITPSATTGTPGTAYRWAGPGVRVLSAVSKGSPLGVDVTRFGRGELRVAGGSLADGYATFSGIAAQNDNNSNRWGLFQAIEGGYKWKGLLTLGYGALTEFTDSDANIVVDNTEFVTTGFNNINIINASSVVNWNNVSISSLSTVSPGDLTVSVADNPVFNDTGGSYSDMRWALYGGSNSTITNKNFNRIDIVESNGATFTGCSFNGCGVGDSGFYVYDDINLVTNCDFVAGVTGHAIYGFNTAGDYNLVGLSFSGYAASNGSTGNEAIWVDLPSGIVNLYLTGGTIPSIRTTGATVNVIQAATLTVGGIRAGSDVFIYRADNKTLLSSADPVTVTDGSPVNGVQYYKLVYAYNASSLGGVAVEIKVFNLGYVNERINYSLTTSLTQRVAVQQRIDRNYDNP